MFTTEQKLKPKQNLQLFAICYDFKNLQHKPLPINKSSYSHILAIVNAANHDIYGGKIDTQTGEPGQDIGGVSRAIVQGLHYLIPQQLKNMSTPEEQTKNEHNTIFKVLAEIGIRETFPNYIDRLKYPYERRVYTLYDNLIMYDDIEEYIKDANLKYTDELPILNYKTYLIHVAGPNYNQMNIYDNKYLEELKINDKSDEEQWKLILERTLETLMKCVEYLKITDLYLPLISGNIYAPNKDPIYALEVHAKVLTKYSHLKLNVYIVDYKQSLLDKSIEYLSKTFVINGERLSSHNNLSSI
jgi:hypothetical protein